MSKINWAPFSENALYSMANCDAFINLYEGAVRSSKTVASSISWIDFIEDSPHREFLMTGKTADTLYRNVLDGDVGILNILGPKRAKYIKGGEGGAKLRLKFGKVKKTCYCLGANDARAEGNLRGMTIGGWYADETTLYPETFVKQAINRMSLDGAQAFWTMNPDSPYHYIKKEFINKAGEKGIRVFHFKLDDNLSLTQRYKDNLKKAYSGLWYKRMVEGQWVMADGIIYDMFDHDLMIAKKLPLFSHYWVGVDYGTSNATTFLLMGLGLDGRLYQLDEYYHSGKESGKQKSPSKYSEDFFKWLGSWQVMPQTVWIDPSAEAFIVQLWQDRAKYGFPTLNIQAADNDVKLGIELTSSVISNDLFRVHKRNEHTLEEFASYVWDEKAQERGEDKPLKKNDHCMDPIRYVINGTRKIWFRKGVTTHAAA